VTLSTNPCRLRFFTKEMVVSVVALQVVQVFVVEMIVGIVLQVLAVHKLPVEQVNLLLSLQHLV
jgi:hypothetical protein